MELSKEIEDIISDAIHDVCEECIARHDCNKPCFEVVRMRQLAEDVVKAERERCIKAFREWYCKTTCNHICDIKQMCENAAEIRKAIEEGGNENERQIES